MASGPDVMDDLSLAPSELDSARFGLRIGRVSLPRATAVPAELVERFRRSDLDILVLRHDATDVGAAWTLEQAAASDVVALHADTLVHFSGDAGEVLDELPQGYRFTTDVGPAALEAAVRETFAEYGNHYSANPLTRDEDVLEAYVEWALAHLGDESCIVIGIVDETDDLAAYLTGTVHGRSTSLDLGGVADGHGMQGLYQHLLDEISRRSLDRGVKRLTVSTQSGNIAVQRAWGHRSWRLNRTEQTRHLIRRELLDGLTSTD